MFAALQPWYPWKLCLPLAWALEACAFQTTWKAHLALQRTSALTSSPRDEPELCQAPRPGVSLPPTTTVAVAGAMSALKLSWVWK